ncbi:alpha/beta fold hydrolase [Streptomyces chryseus]|uniref:alpha/beta fold hydrolase n=1 Tax=Streptomyces chryseus TaxID=68186 RepID=UPI0034E0602F
MHGWLADRGAFAAVLPDLDTRTFSYAVVDLRGYGEARRQPGRYTTAEGAADVLELADRLGWDSFSLVGHSMGGSVVQRVLAAAPRGTAPGRRVARARERAADAARAVGALRGGGRPAREPARHPRLDDRREPPGRLARPDGAPVGGAERPEGVPRLVRLLGR